MIGTFCRSCRTISRAIKDRCSYCGSQHTCVTSVDEKLIKHGANGREIVEEENGNQRKARSSVKET